MAITTAAALIASAAIGTASAVYSANEQSKAADKQEEARRKAEEEARRIAMETRPEEVGATLDVGGSTSIGSKTQSTADFLIPRQSTLGSTGSSGLGFKV